MALVVLALPLQLPLLHLIVALPLNMPAGTLERTVTAEGPVKALAATESGGVVVTEHAVTVLDASGQRVRSLWSRVAPPVRRPPRAGTGVLGGSWSALGLPPNADWARRYDLEEIEDPDDPRLADERDPRTEEFRFFHTAPPEESTKLPHAPVASAAGGQAMLTAGGRRAWIMRSDGLWEVDLRNAAVSRLQQQTVAGGQRVAASADGGVVVVLKGHDVYRSRDGAQSFEMAASLQEPPRGGAAVMDAGEIVLVGADGRALIMVAPGGREIQSVALPGEGRILDIASCGNVVAVLQDKAILMAVVRDEALAVGRVAGTPAEARMMACGENGSSLAVAGATDLHWSIDGGRSWRRWAAVGTAGSITDLAFGRRQLWVGTTAGLSTIPMKSQPLPDRVGAAGAPGLADSAETAGAHPLAALDRGMSGERFELLRPRWWNDLLPRVDLLFGVARTDTRRDFHGLIVLTFSASGGLAATLTRQGAAALKAARWHASQRRSHAVDLHAFGPGGERDRFSAAERAALIRVLQESSP